MKFRPLFLAISSVLILTSLFSIIAWRFKPSIDFAGGTVWEISLPSVSDQNQIKQIFDKDNIGLSSMSSEGQNKYLLKFPNINEVQKAGLDKRIKELDKNYQELRFETLSPSLGKELLKKTIFAVILSSIALLIFIGRRFSDVTFGTSAVLAMLHDTFILIGSFSLLGHFFGAELDSLFVTALLTTLSSSVHDTVVTFNRMKELKRQSYNTDWVSLANQAVTETLTRSINNSMTIIFMLLALVVLGGATTKWFATALLIGVVCGTYSSTAVAIPLVLFWKKKSKK